MDPRKKAALKAAGWTSGTIPELLQMSPEETALFELKVQLAILVRQRRQFKGWSQTRLATEVQSSQSRIAKAESAERSASVSMDLLVRCLFATGITTDELARSLFQAHVTAFTMNQPLTKSGYQTFPLGKPEAANSGIKNLSDIFELA